ncbi:sensor domain-containing protein [Rhodococcus sp. NPDC003322]
MTAGRMRVAGLVAALAVTPALVSCGEDSSDPVLPPVTTVAAPTAPATTTVDEAGLTAALLTVADLPAGFAALPDPVADLGLPEAAADSESDRSSTDPQACAGVLAPIADQVPGAAAQGVARFAGPDFTSIDTDAAAYPDSGAAQAFTAVQSTFASCADYSGTDADGVTVHYRLGGLDQPTVGDASVAVRLETSSEGFTMTSDTVVAVVGGAVVQVTATGQQPIEPAVLTRLARTAVDRLRAGTD